jgi:hypothetical protein
VLAWRGWAGVACPASQTASQSMRQPAIIWGHQRTLLTAAAALPGAPEITDTEGVIASMNVTDT